MSRRRAFKPALFLCMLGALLAVSCAHTPPIAIPSVSSNQSLNPDSLAIGHARIVLRWQTETETNTFGYYVYRSEAVEGKLVCINEASPVHGQGTSSVPLKYAYFDLAVRLGGTYYYKLQARDLDGTSEWIVGADKPVTATAKPLTAAELEEVRTKGQSYREEAR